MDDELKAIQADLDSVLDRLEKRFSLQEQDIDEYLGSALYHYVMRRKKPVPNNRPWGHFSAAFELVDGWERHRRIYFPEYLWQDLNSEERQATAYQTGPLQEAKAEFIYAIDVLMTAGRKDLPPPRKTLATLAPAFKRYLDCVDRYPGEWGLDQKDRHRLGIEKEHPFRHRSKLVNRKLYRQLELAWRACELRSSTPEQYSIGPALWEAVAAEFDVSVSDTTVSRAYYSEAGKLARREFERMENDGLSETNKN